jgi:hypothetical protein
MKVLNNCLLRMDIRHEIKLKSYFLLFSLDFPREIEPFPASRKDKILLIYLFVIILKNGKSCLQIICSNYKE